MTDKVAPHFDVLTSSATSGRVGEDVRDPATKRAFDLMAILLLAPALPFLLGLIALAVRLDSRGPIFFRQDRYGLDGKIIRVTKFRTMKVEETCASGARQAVRGDPRVTSVGRFLRATCADELPQILDVLMGRMSLVGPRPHPVGMEIEGQLAETVIPNYMLRHRMRPGLTGLAQVNGNRGPVHDVATGVERITYDNAYIASWSLGADLRILFRTITLPFRPGCY